MSVPKGEECPKCGMINEACCLFCGQPTARGDIRAAVEHVLTCKKHPLASVARQIERLTEIIRVQDAEIAALQAMVFKK